MKKLHTLLCCICMAIAGGFLAVLQPSEANASSSYNTISAAVPTLNWAPNVGQLPLDLQLDLEKKYEKPPEVIHDTIYDTKIVYVKSKRKAKSTLPYAQVQRSGDSTPAAIPDTPVVEKVDVDREEHTTDSIGPPKASVILIVDGKEVYKR